MISAPENEGTCLVQLKIDKSIVNINSVLHGGATASLVDLVSTIALFNTANKKPGVSVNMNINYLKAAKLDETILIEGKVIKSGTKLAYLEANIYLKKQNSFELDRDKLVAVGFHTKYIVWFKITLKLNKIKFFFSVILNNTQFKDKILFTANIINFTILF